jgi:adenylate kinase family enzyme
MRRIMVIGCAGAGKSTLARRLAERLALPLVALDSVFWKPGWVASPLAEFRETVARLAATPAWIMDGNYSNTYDLRMPRAHIILWLDYSRWTCMRSVLARTARGYGRVRDGLPAGCPERIDMEFFNYVWTFDRFHRPRIVAGLDIYAKEARIERFESRKEAERFFARVERG